MIPHTKVSRADVARALRDLEILFSPPDPAKDNGHGTVAEVETDKQIKLPGKDTPTRRWPQ